MGWERAAIDGQRIWIHARYPRISDPELSAEVLFGALRRFGVSFTEQLADVFDEATPGALHEVAASVLQAGGCVWTTNVDVAIEAACDQAGFAPPMSGRAADRAPDLMRPLVDAAPGTLIKLHGTAARPETMAFTDRELMTPLPASEVDHLASLAEGRMVVLYGYAGADADLADMLDEVMIRAREVVWLEPFQWVRDEIAGAFRHHARIHFEPELDQDETANIRANAEQFLTLAAAAGAAPRQGLARALVGSEAPPGPPKLKLPTPPGIAQARLVERFGAPNTHADALWSARWDDLQHLRWHTLEGHARWAVTRSLYNDGAVSHAVRWVSRHRWLLQRARPQRLRDYVITRQCAVLLPEGRWLDLGHFAQWAIETRVTAAGRPYPTDLYYRAHARRYDLRPRLAAEDADAAVDGLSSEVVSDPERLAGALLEAGMAAIYTGRFEDALARAFDLHSRRGRYAIQRWRGWGRWLAAIAHCHLQQPDDAHAELQEAESRFTADGRRGPVHDVLTARLLATRVALATGASPDRRLVDQAATASIDGRYKEDLELILADIDIAEGEHDRARRRLQQLRPNASNEVSRAMSDLGLAELGRLEGRRQEAAEAFAILGQRCVERGAIWLAAQAALGVQLCGDTRWEPLWASAREALPDERHADQPADLAVGEPRVLWLLTI